MARPANAGRVALGILGVGVVLILGSAPAQAQTTTITTSGATTTTASSTTTSAGASSTSSATTRAATTTLRAATTTRASGKSTTTKKAGVTTTTSPPISITPTTVASGIAGSAGVSVPLVAETISQPGQTGFSNPTVRPFILGLVGLGGVLTLVSIWFWRVTRPVPDALDRLRRVRR